MLGPDIDLKKTVGNDLWLFACDVYDRPKVADICLILQDRYGVDIPLLLFCCWAGRCYGELSLELLQQASSFSKGWSVNTTKPLRAIRRDMKTSYSQQWPISDDEWSRLRGQVKQLELASEKLMLEGLSQLINQNATKYKTLSVQDTISEIITNIKSIFNISNDQDVVDHISVFLKYAFNQPVENTKTYFNN